MDLGAPREIKAVEITNRGDCCGDRLNGFSVRVGNTLCASGVSISLGQTKQLTCEGVGSTIRVELPGSDRVLTICEFRVAVEARTARSRPWGVRDGAGGFDCL